mmetsp:Transcript_3768/g.11662  ORF Transcript_3768/g.11662 Transcript_3768/m.11662 type:complete len:394 (-) Transcript_3768:452-1633(-)
MILSGEKRRKRWPLFFLERTAHDEGAGSRRRRLSSEEEEEEEEDSSKKMKAPRECDSVGEEAEDVDVGVGLWTFGDEAVVGKAHDAGVEGGLVEVEAGGRAAAVAREAAAHEMKRRRRGGGAHGEGRGPVQSERCQGSSGEALVRGLDEEARAALEHVDGPPFAELVVAGHVGSRRRRRVGLEADLGVRRNEQRRPRVGGAHGNAVVRPSLDRLPFFARADCRPLRRRRRQDEHVRFRRKGQQARDGKWLLLRGAGPVHEQDEASSLLRRGRRLPGGVAAPRRTTRPPQRARARAAAAPAPETCPPASPCSAPAPRSRRGAFVSSSIVETTKSLCSSSRPPSQALGGGAAPQVTLSSCRMSASAPSSAARLLGSHRRAFSRRALAAANNARLR